MDGLPETIWIRDDQDGGIELTDRFDPVACEYIRADIPDVVQTLIKQIKESEQRADELAHALEWSTNTLYRCRTSAWYPFVEKTFRNASNC